MYGKTFVLKNMKVPTNNGILVTVFEPVHDPDILNCYRGPRVYIDKILTTSANKKINHVKTSCLFPIQNENYVVVNFNEEADGTVVQIVSSSNGLFYLNKQIQTSFGSYQNYVPFKNLLRLK
jgi:hypothetical protein